MASYCGTHLHMSIFGESHGNAVGVTLDGLPAGEPVDLDTLQTFLSRRAPGKSALSTPRREADTVEILSGLYRGRTCGAPLTALIRNTDARSEEYDPSGDLPRPGHADYTAALRYGGFHDPRGGGHFSGRLTAPICIAGGLALQILARRGVHIAAHILSVADIRDRAFDPMGEDIAQVASPLPVLDPQAGARMEQAILAAGEAGDSLGGIVECMARGLPGGLGSPMLQGLESTIASLLFAIPAVKGVDFGAGFSAAALRGSEHNDPFFVSNGKICTNSNRHGGILGGISTGMPLVLRAAFKPTPSIGREQRSVRLSTLEETPLTVKGRHDPCIVPRAVPVVEGAVAIALLDAWLEFGLPEGRP